jgi:hypothetical protein
MAEETKRKDARIETPQHNAEVLLSFGGLYYIGTYNVEARGFETREGNFFVVNDKAPPIFWSELPKG